MNHPVPADTASRDHQESSAPDIGGLSRRGLVTGAAVAAGLAIVSGSAPGAASAANRNAGTVADAPDLPRGFADTFTDRVVDANGIRQHVVIGGDGPPLLLVHGWPESWYAWRLMMPALAQSFTVIAVDQRGVGLTDGPDDGYDAATLATDLAELMQALGYSKYAVVGHDTGYVISYALAWDYPDRVDRVVLAEIPGPPGVGAHPVGPPYFVTAPVNNRLWHVAFNRVDDELIVDMVKSNAAAYYEYEFVIQGGGATPTKQAKRYYVDLYTRSRDTLRSTFGLYRAWETTVLQNIERAKVPLALPVLGIGGEFSYGGAAASALTETNAATDVQSAVIPGVGHWVAENAPDAMVEVISQFLEPYRTA